MNKSMMCSVAGLAAFAAFALVRPASAQVGGFPDVPPDHWAAQSVAKLSAAGIVKGYPAGQKKPAPKKDAYDGNKPVTRYELAVTLYRFVEYLEKVNKQPKTKMGAQAFPQNGAEAVRRLIASGYLPAKTPLAQNGTKLVTANELADAMAQIITVSRVKNTPITPESLRTQPIEKPGNVPGT